MQRDSEYYRSQASRIVGDKPWFDRPMRWAQLTLVENDPGRYSPSEWLAYLSRIGADGVCLSAGGCVAYYPTEVPWHHRSAWMRPGDDPFGELLAGCREMGMIALARIMMPRSKVRLSAGRTELSREAQLLCLYAGANSIFYGDKLLTTPNPGQNDDMDLIEAAGLQPQAQQAAPAE